jgi:hypothetical protein
VQAVVGTAHVLDRHKVGEVQPGQETALGRVAIPIFGRGDTVAAQHFDGDGGAVPETARVPGVSERTPHRHGRFIKAWLQRRLRGPGEPA